MVVGLEVGGGPCVATLTTHSTPRHQPRHLNLGTTSQLGPGRSSACPALPPVRSMVSRLAAINNLAVPGREREAPVTGSGQAPDRLWTGSGVAAPATVKARKSCAVRQGSPVPA